MLYNSSISSPIGPSSSSEALNSVENSNRRKRRPAGTPDPDAEVVSLSPKTLLESDRYICEICNQGFQRDQNLQMHRRRHKVPWKLVKRENPQVKKRVFVCPEPSCLHHDPCHALGDLVGIKKHFRRKHSNNKQWICEKCGKGYAVQSDYKAHLKTCGTRGHSCDCGRVFSRVESFIEHQDTCTIRRIRPNLQTLQPTAACSSSTSPSSDTNLQKFAVMSLPNTNSNLELGLLPSTRSTSHDDDDHHEIQEPQLKLSIGSLSQTQSTTTTPKNGHGQKNEVLMNLAMAEKAYAEEARRNAKREMELAEMEFANAKRIRQQAQGEIERAKKLKEEAIKRIRSSILEITCHACKNKFQESAPIDNIEFSPAMSYMSCATTDVEGEQ